MRVAVRHDADRFRVFVEGKTVAVVAAGAGMGGRAHTFAQS